MPEFYSLICLAHAQVAEVEDKTAGGLLLTEASKEKPSIGTVSPFMYSTFLHE